MFGSSQRQCTRHCHGSTYSCVPQNPPPLHRGADQPHGTQPVPWPVTQVAPVVGHAMQHTYPQELWPGHRPLTARKQGCTAGESCSAMHLPHRNRGQAIGLRQLESKAALLVGHGAQHVPPPPLICHEQQQVLLHSGPEVMVCVCCLPRKSCRGRWAESCEEKSV